jgi:kinesin family protein 5
MSGNKYPTLRPKNTGCKVQVCCRFRPLNKKEKSELFGISQMEPMSFIDEGSLKIYNPHRVEIEKKELKETINKIIKENKNTRYNFDKFFTEKADQKEVYDYVGKPIIKELMNGYNCTVFAYGQTSCLDPEQGVLMYDGKIKKAKDVQLGDQVMGDDSTPRNVLELYSGEDEMYKIIPYSGDPYIVNQNHKLTLQYSCSDNLQWCEDMKRYKVHYCKNGEYKCKTFMVHGNNSKPKNNNEKNLTKEGAKKTALEYLKSVSDGNKLIDIPVKEYVKKSKVWKRLHKGLKTGVDFPEKEVSLEPYLLGVWLGDGHKHMSDITNIDEEILDYVKKEATKMGCRWVKKGITLRITRNPPNERKRCNYFLSKLKKYNLVNNKHIPHDFLINSRKNRLALLAGILDTDGYYSKEKNNYEITQKNEKLFDDIVFLSRSLGFKSNKKKIRKSCIYKGEKKTGTYYRCFISGKHLSEIPVLVSRKKASKQIDNDNENSNELIISGFKIESIGKGKYNGFLLDGNHRFILSTFDITHNCGKTYSMFGYDVDSGRTGVWKNKEGMGIIPRAVNDIFTHINTEVEDDIEYTIQVSFLEIYLEKLRDLLNPNNKEIKIRETRDGDIYVEGLKEVYVGSFDDVLTLIAKGQKHRVTAETKMNQYSSRSHSLIIIKIGQTNLTKHTKTKSKLVLVDLAGSERISKSGVQGLTLTQVKHINKSLLMLGNVINSITEKQPHIPYRDSKLTRLLQDSLGGNSKTCLLINCSPSWINLSETICTLNFGARAKKIENKPRINKELTVDDYRILIDEASQKIIKQENKIKMLEEQIETLLKETGNEPNLLTSTTLMTNNKMIETLQHKISELDNIVLKQKKIETDLKEVIDNQKNDILVNIEEINYLKEKIEGNKKIIYGKDEDISALNSDNNKLKLEHKNLEIKIFDQDVKIRELLKDKEQLNNEIKKLNSKIIDLNNNYQEKLNNKNIEIKTLEDKISTNIDKDNHFKNKIDKIEEEHKNELLQLKSQNTENLEKVKSEFDKQTNNLQIRYKEFNKQYDKLKNELKIKIEEIMILQLEKEQLQLSIQKLNIKNKTERQNSKEKEIIEASKDREIDKLKKSLQRKTDETMRIKADMDEAVEKYDQTKEDIRLLERQIRRLRSKNNKLNNLNNLLNNKTDTSDNEIGDKTPEQVKTLKRNLKKMRDYNIHIRGREKYYLKTIDNRRQQIELLEESLKEASTISNIREQEHLTVIRELEGEISRYRNILREIGIPEEILCIRNKKIIVPLKTKY